MTGKERNVFIAGAASGLLIAVLGVGAFVARELHSQAAEHNHAMAAPQPAADASPNIAAAPEPASSLQLSPEEITAAGVQVAEARVQRLKTDIESFGRVEQPETQLSAQSARIGGRVDRLYVQYGGEQVRRGQKIAELYSPEVATAGDEYRLALRNRERLSQSDDKSAMNAADALVAASRRKLELWGITKQQIEAPESSGVPHITLYATTNGTVVERKVTQGQYVNAGDTMFTLADLSQVWIKADVYESQLPLIRPSQAVEVTSDALPNRAIHGRVDFIEPNANPQTRTVPVHIHVANPGMRLVPGMFVRANFVSTAAQPAVVVPRSAVLDTGTHKIVYIANENGGFESREVEVGTPTEDLFPVSRGLKAGEKVVIAGNFLIDSQTRLSSGMSGLYGGSKEFANGGSAHPGAPTPAEQSTARISFRVEPDPAKGGADNTFHIMLTGSDGNAVADAQVKVTLTMPAMPAMNMPEMRNSFDVPFIGGMYMGKGTVPMEGSWNVMVEASRNGKVIASHRTRLTAK
jgi:membrane fusion protein, copper/silver efflux system